MGANSIKKIRGGGGGGGGGASQTSENFNLFKKISIKMYNFSEFYIESCLAF